MADFIAWFPVFFATFWSMVTSSWLLSYGIIILVMKWIVDIYKSSRSQ